MPIAAGVVDRALARVGKRVFSCIERRGAVHVQARSTVRVAPCPRCRCWSSRLHGSYTRRLAERPILDNHVLLSVEMRRFKCLNAGCARRRLQRTFALWQAGISVEPNQCVFRRT